MIAVWLTTRRGTGRKKLYAVSWQLPEIDAAGNPIRYPSGRGKQRVFAESCHTSDRKTAEAIRQKKHRQLNGLEAVSEPAKHLSIEELIRLDAEWLQNRGRAEGTIYLSALALKQLAASLQARGRPQDADAVTPQDIEAFIAERRKEVKAIAVNHALAALRATWNRAVKHDLLAVNPFAAVERVQEMPRPIVPLTPGEESKLIAAGAGDLELDAFVRLALDSGARAGELCNLRVQDLDLDNGLGRIECNTEWRSKTKRNRPMVFTPETAARVRLWLAQRNGSKHVFRDLRDGPRVTYSRLSRRFKATVERSGIGRNVTLQDCRRTVGSLLAERGVNQRVAMEYLGHSNIATTARFYQAVRADTLKATVLNLRPTGSGD